jgi:hypothetical protein
MRVNDVEGVAATVCGAVDIKNSGGGDFRRSQRYGKRWL